MRITLITLILWFGVFTPVVNAQDITFEATVDKPRMSFQDVLIFSLVISGGNIDTNLTPELPDLKKDFEVLRGPSRSSSISIINGKYSSSITLQYILSPKHTGTLKIDPATLQYNKKTYTTTPITIEVVKETQPQMPPTPQSPGSQQPEGSFEDMPDVYLRVEVNKETAYIGEQITLAYYLCTRINISDYRIQEPTFPGFWVENLEIPNPPLLEYRNVNGIQYGVALMKKVALFPASSGDITIDPMVMSLYVKVRTRPGTWPQDPFDNFLGRTQEIIRKTQPIELKILPLPEENRPDIFNGNVGNYTMSVFADKTEVKQDEPITLTVKIQGTGNIKTVKEPTITLPEALKRYDPEITENAVTSQDILQGEKAFKSVVIPSSPGEYHIEPVQFAYFDPGQKTYQVLRSEPMNIVILPSAQKEEPLERRIATKEEIKLLDKDIRFIKSDVPHLDDQGRAWYRNGMFQFAHILPILCVVAVYSYKRYHEKYRSDERYIRSKRARKASRKHFDTARDLMRRGESKEFYAAVSSALRQYIGDKLNLPPAGITGTEISQALRNYGLDEETANLLKQCLADCDFARFAPVGSNPEQMNTTLHNAETIINQLEKLKLKMKIPGIAALIVLCLCLKGFADMSGEALFQQGNKFYETGKYQKAIEAYQTILDSGLKNGYVYYNLGNALLKERRIGEAILAYERAKRLMPRDEDVAFNLDYARALTLDKMEQWNSGKITTLLVSIRDYFTSNEVSLFFFSMYVLLTCLAIAGMFASHLWRRRLIYIALVPALLFLCSGTLLFFQIYHNATVTEAILLTPKIEAKTGPGEGYSTVFEIHAGAKVRIQREKLDWVEIKLPNKLLGWVLRKDLAQIDIVHSRKPMTN